MSPNMPNARPRSLAAEELLDQAGVLRGEEAGGGALHEAGDDHQRRAGGQPDGGAGERRSRSGRSASAGAGRRRPRAGRRRPGSGRRRARSPRRPTGRSPAEVSRPALHRRDRDVDDGDVEQRHEADDERDAEDPPASRVRHVRRLGGVGAREGVVGHRSSMSQASQPGRAPAGMMGRMALTVRISGRVQGVSFRWETQRQAERLGVTGVGPQRAGRVGGRALRGRAGGRARRLVPSAARRTPGSTASGRRGAGRR